MTKLNNNQFYFETTKHNRLSLMIRRFCMDKSGVAAVEFVFILPILISLTIGTIQYGLAFFTYNTMHNVARDGARALSVGALTESQIEAAAPSRLSSWASTWHIDAQDVATTGNDEVKMIITVPGSEAGILRLLPMPEVLKVQVVMRKE